MFIDYIHYNQPRRPYEPWQKLENIAGRAAGGELTRLLALLFIPTT